MDFYGDDAATTIVLVTLKTAVGLLGIWLGSSSISWFWRGTIALGLTALLIPPRAYDPAIGMLVQIALVAAVIGIAKRWQQRYEHGGFFRWRFQLSDLFRIVFLFSLALALSLFLIRRPRLCEFPWLCLESLLQASATLLVAAIVTIPTRWIWRWIPIIPLVPIGMAVSIVEFRIATGAEEFESYWEAAEMLFPAFLIRNGLLIVSQFLMLTAFFIGKRPLEKTSVSMLRRSASIIARILLIGSGTIAASLIAFVWWQLTFLPTPPQLVIPSPNGYDLAGNAAKLIQGNVGLDPETATTAELATIVQANQRPISLIREAVEQTWQRPLTFEEGADFTMIDLLELRQLFQTVRHSVHLALREQRMDDAVTGAIVNLRFGCRIRNGGLNTDYMFGSAFESDVIGTLKRVRADFNVAQYRRLITALQAIDEEHAPMDQINALDRIWSLHQYGYQYALIDTIRVLMPRQTRTLLFDARVYDAIIRLLTVDFAIRAFRLEHGRLPETLDELAPNYLSSLPLDPYSQRPFLYRLEKNDEFVLYTAGPDEDDDGGKSMSWQAAYLGRKSRNGDFFLDFWDESSPGSRPANAVADDESK